MRVSPRAVSFDLDDTLWSCDEVIERAERAVYDWLALRYPRITEEFDLESMRRIRIETAERTPGLAVDLTALRRHTLQWHAARAGYGTEVAEAGVEVFLAERHRVTLYDDVRPVLEALRARFPLIALTNGNADIRRTDLGALFDVAVTAADVGAAKPDPAMFRHACEHLEVDAAELVHVGDDPVRDVHAARRFGARTVWINRNALVWPGDVPRAHHEVTSLHELHRVLAGDDAGETAAGEPPK